MSIKGEDIRQAKKFLENKKLSLKILVVLLVYGYVNGNKIFLSTTRPNCASLDFGQ